MTDTILVDGVDVASAARIVKVWEGVHVGAEQRGELLTYPGRDGQVDVDQPFDATVLSLGLIVRGGSGEVTGFNDQYRTLRRLCKPGKTVTLTKQLSYSTGNEEYTATGKLLRITPGQLTPADYRAVVEFLNLDGLWYGAPTAIGTGAVTVAGDVRTQRMTITLTGAGSSKTLTNTTNGWSLTYAGTTASSVVIDVEAMTATQGGVDKSSLLSWTKGMPMRLEPGANTLTISAGAAAISYRPAFL